MERAIDADALLAWYDVSGRRLPWRLSKDPYAIWLSEVMLQQTQVTTVVPYYQRFLKAFPTAIALADAHEDRVLKMWEGLGYYNRCHNLLKAMRRVRDDHGGQVPGVPEIFSALPGVGSYTCAAVQSIAFGHQMAAVDGNVIRVVSRFLAMEEVAASAVGKRRVQQLVDRSIPRRRPGDFNQAMMELGATVCTPKHPACGRCPIAESCLAKKEGKQEAFPVKKRRNPVPTFDVALAAVVRESGEVLIQKRPASGHLAGMWEFPGGKVLDGESHEQALCRSLHDELGLAVEVKGAVGVASHAYSHFKVRVFLYLCRASESFQKVRQGRKGKPVSWVVAGGLDALAFPAVNRKLFPLLRPYLEHS